MFLDSFWEFAKTAAGVVRMLFSGQKKLVPVFLIFVTRGIALVRQGELPLPLEYRTRAFPFSAQEGQFPSAHKGNSP